ncbi:hypothetical protein PXK56_17830 [Phaeobacter gallaeciensis]|uniref:hypothetical protein n=1 Tax=Phaeobacter gallaeciensis TaxID=60890 RepID=UPI0023806DDF|nr:hypothetical protein [Phaeobacter gallaeciensis]MDE4297049.1 hypothetical protein [Phaeobacter gallaeciensis]
MSFATKKKSVAEIVAPIGKIVADLRALATREEETIEARNEQISDLESKNAASKNEAERASKLAEKYEGLIV